MAVERAETGRGVRGERSEVLKAAGAPGRELLTFSLRPPCLISQNVSYRIWMCCF